MRAKMLVASPDATTDRRAGQLGRPPGRQSSAHTRRAWLGKGTKKPASDPHEATLAG
jgi:hypothetical protein